MKDDGTLYFAGLSDVGQKRTENEDRFVCSTDEGFCILADGMGGRLFGEVASQMAVEILARHIREDFPASYRKLDRMDQGCVAINLLNEWIRDVNQKIWRKGQEDERYREMGTTIVCLFALDKQVILAHVGDSRCYRLRKGEFHQLTDDHSLVNSQVKSGHLTAQEAREASHKNIITRAVGTSDQVKPDLAAIPLHVGDRFLVCSDGLSDMVTDDEMRNVLSAAETLETQAKKLIDLANRNGGRDNITAILAEYRVG